MDSNSLLALRLKMQSNKFSGIISKEFSKPKQKLIQQMIYGIQASKDVKLSNIGRALKEDIALIKTEDRLSRNLCDEDFTHAINEHIMRLGSGKIDDDMVIAIDPGDMNKPYAKAMENLCGIYDGSQHTQAKGYHLCQVTAANLKHDKVVPLYCEAYSSFEKNYQNATEKIKAIISKVKKHTGIKGNWAIDRQGDNISIIKHFLDEELNFITRLKGNRWLHIKKNTTAQVQAERVIRHIEMPYKSTFIKVKDGKEELITLRFGITKAALPDMPEKWFNLLVIEGFGQQPMVLLTNIEVNIHDTNQVWQLVEIYLTRWKCDECYRYIKQSYNLEDFRVRSYVSIRNITVLVHAIAYFTSIYMGTKIKLNIMVQKIFILSKRIFGVPTFFNYAMADGIYELLKMSKTGIEFKGKTGPPIDDYQFNLSFE